MEIQEDFRELCALFNAHDVAYSASLKAGNILMAVA